ncbi:MAG: hypothetical protein QNJ74_15020 [Trichodesmium sp. MO_231.B1]|nr:hypothetical protein [Trichodesmium sp. MO_231.B1]
MLCDFFSYDQRLVQQAWSTQDKSLATEEKTADERGEEFTEKLGLKPRPRRATF